MSPRALATCSPVRKNTPIRSAATARIIRQAARDGPPTRGTVVDRMVIQAKEEHVGAAMQARAILPGWTTWGLKLAADTTPGASVPSLPRPPVRCDVP